MGICYGTPVDNHSHIHSHSPETTKPSSPDEKLRDNQPNKPEENIVVEDMPSSGKIVTPNMKMYTLAELRAATKNFRPDTVLGEGGFGRVFKGWVDEKTYAPSKVGMGMAVAVKKSNPDSLQGLNEWQAEVKFLGKFSHPNLVKLLGYCWEDRQFLLVYEYMQKGSLENHLFRKAAEPLSWNIRLKIAIGAAKGLTFLHSSEKSVIYRDFKASNILLDADYNAKLSDFGLAKLGPINGNSHVTTRVMGTYGYAAPEYVATGHLYVRSDVYGFGVVLLEMLTGLRALDTNRPSGNHNLVEYAKPSLSDRRKLKKIMDPRLEEQYPAKAASQCAELILKCLESDPKSRPSMDQVLENLEEISAIEVDPKKVRAKAKRNSSKQRQESSSSSSSHQHHHHGHYRSPMHSKHGDNGTRARCSQRPSMVR
ncbi:probable serine/threonine-protein kinase PIX13 isoform X1 [Pistacia vera]|uniref:probable serine/threonine-protein kinase PIX13 isoform X1 n=1 Tax=Pistacia vera TaxID=55513 RepID=UPI001262FA0D|nr:probable serine/threonine-protein kinase PIX13 isoform X1 [Pistacia vera]